MRRIEQDELSMHLQISLALARPWILHDIGMKHRERREHAMQRMTEHLVQRLEGFEIFSTRASLQPPMLATLPLFPMDCGADLFWSSRQRAMEQEIVTWKR